MNEIYKLTNAERYSALALVRGGVLRVNNARLTSRPTAEARPIIEPPRYVQSYIMKSQETGQTLANLGNWKITLPLGDL